MISRKYGQSYIANDYAGFRLINSITSEIHSIFLQKKLSIKAVLLSLKRVGSVIFGKKLLLIIVFKKSLKAVRSLTFKSQYYSPANIISDFDLPTSCMREENS